MHALYYNLVGYLAWWLTFCVFKKTVVQPCGSQVLRSVCISPSI
jgi:hypothetical protein